MCIIMCIEAIYSMIKYFNIYSWWVKRRQKRFDDEKHLYDMEYSYIVQLMKQTMKYKKYRVDRTELDLRNEIEDPFGRAFLHKNIYTSIYVDEKFGKMFIVKFENAMDGFKIIWSDY